MGLRLAVAFTINGASPGSTGAMTPVAIGTSTPVLIIPCGFTLNGMQQNSTTGFRICPHGGTVGTDKVFCAPAPVSNQTPAACAAASPAPNAGTKAGWQIPTETCDGLDYPAFGGIGVLSSEWDCVGTTSGMTVEWRTLP